MLNNVLAVTQSNSIICDRAFEFASRILKMCDRMYELGPSATGDDPKCDTDCAFV